MTWVRRTTSGPQTQLAGEQFVKVLRAGDVVLLNGSLGAGKTTFVQGAARALGVSERVTSPTFTVVRQHQCHNAGSITTLHHADIYRVEQVDEIIDLAISELVEEDAVALVEWGELAGANFGSQVLIVDFSFIDDDIRDLTVSGSLSAQRRFELDAWVAS